MGYASLTHPTTPWPGPDGAGPSSVVVGCALGTHPAVDGGTHSIVSPWAAGPAALR
jgi:hypothetical protein